MDGPARGERGDGAALRPAEREILTGDDAGDPQRAFEPLGDEVLRGQRREVAVEMEHDHRVCAGLGEQAFALVERGQAEGGCIGAEMADRVGIEGRDERGATLGLCPGDRAPDHRLVAEMESVEIAERDDSAGKMRGDRSAPVEPLHGVGL